MFLKQMVLQGLFVCFKSCESVNAGCLLDLKDNCVFVSHWKEKLHLWMMENHNQFHRFLSKVLFFLFLR